MIWDLRFAIALLALVGCGKAEPPPTPAPAVTPPPAPAREPVVEAEPADTPTPVPEPPASPPQDGKGAGVVLRRRVQLVLRDLVGKTSEIHRLETVKLQKGCVSIDDETFGTRLIIRTDRRLAWVIDRTAGSCSELTFDAIAERRKKILADLSDAQRRVTGTADGAEIETLVMGLGAATSMAPVTVQDTGKNGAVAGRPCVGREVLIGADIHYIDVLVDPSLQAALEYFDALAAMGGLHPAVADAIRKLGGFPLKGVVRYALFLDRIVATEEVLSVTRLDLPDSDFDRPAGLTSVPLRGFDPDGAARPAKPKSFERSFREDDLDRETNPFRDRPKDEKEPRKP